MKNVFLNIPLEVVDRPKCRLTEIAIGFFIDRKQLRFTAIVGAGLVYCWSYPQIVCKTRPYILIRRC
ncbi:hypothetical protein QUA43_23115 [Microcoleus sp. N9_B4]